MSLTLSSAEQERLTATARALLSPLDLSSAHGWRGEVLDHLTALLEADAGGFILPVPGEPPYTLLGLPDRFAREYFETGREAEESRRAIFRNGGGAWNTRSLGARLGLRMPEGWFASEDYRSFYGRYGIDDAIGFLATAGAPPLRPRRGHRETTPATAVLTCYRSVYGTELFGDRGLAFLRLLRPALEAGVTARLRLSGQQRALEAVLDSAPYAITVHALRGRRLYGNVASDRLLSREPEADLLEAEIRRGVGILAQLARAREHTGPESLRPASREVHTRSARYRVRLNLLGEGVFARPPVVLVAVDRLTPDAPTRRVLQDRWGLTPQESRVALLLADGGTNREIAAELQLSPATVRHYTEGVFLKLGVHSRAEATARILLS